jgi:hypothetical protein
MGQGGNRLTQQAAIGGDVLSADLQQIVKAARDHVAFLNPGHCAHGGVEIGQRGVAGVRKLHLHKRHMTTAKPRLVDHRAIAADDAGCFKPPQPRQRRGA